MKKKSAKAEGIPPTTNGHSKNGHMKQLKSDQQLTLGRIQRRVLEYQVQANQLVEQSRAMLAQAQAADAEWGKAVQAYANKLGVDLTTIDVDYLRDKLQFKRKEAAPAA